MPPAETPEAGAEVDKPSAADEMPMGMGMMGGMGHGPAAEEKPVAYEATIWGRYAKILLSSSEFLFIN